MQRTTTTTTGATVRTRTTHHDLSLNGRAGAVLILLLVCLVFFIIAFTTAGWQKASGHYFSHLGLWEACSVISSSASYHVATQVLMCLALVGLIIAVILIFLYLFAAGVSKYQVLLGLVIDSFLTFTLMLIAVIVFGASAESTVYWSYGMAVIATILCLCGAIVAAIQLARC